MQRENISTPIYVECRLAVKNAGVSCLASIFDLSNLKMKIMHADNRFKVVRYDDSFTICFC